MKLLYGFSPPKINNLGQTAFQSGVNAPGELSSRLGVYAEKSGSLELLALRGSQAPGLPAGANFRFLDYPVLGDGGDVWFRATATGAGVIDTDDGLWTNALGPVTLIAMQGRPAPGTALRFGNFGVPRVNEAGQAAFISWLNGGISSIWKWSGSLELVYREGDPAPTFPAGVTFRDMSEPALNNLGQLAFPATIIGPGNFSANSVWSESSGTLRLVAKTGDQAPGLPEGVQFGSFRPYVHFSDAGQTAFRSYLWRGGVDDTNDESIWVAGAEGLRLVAREGSPASGMPDSGPLSELSDILLNNRGQVALMASFNGGRGIWVTDGEGILQLIAHTGAAVEVGPGDIRTIRDEEGLDFAGADTNSLHYSGAFNNLGQLAFLARFTDGTEAIIVSNRVAIPEPGTFAIAVNYWLVLSLLRRFLPLPAST